MGMSITRNHPPKREEVEPRGRLEQQRSDAPGLRRTSTPSPTPAALVGGAGSSVLKWSLGRHP